MSLSADLPPRLTCLLCFSPQAMQRRFDVKGRTYYSCPLCNFRFWIHSDTHAFAAHFWSKTLADERLLKAARADLERALANSIPPIKRPVDSGAQTVNPSIAKEPVQ